MKKIWGPEKICIYKKKSWEQFTFVSMYYKRHPNFFSLGLGSFISGENRWDYLLRPMTSHFFRVLFWLQLVWNGIETFWSMAFLFLFAWVIKRLIFQFDYFCSFVYLFIAKGFLSTSSTFLSTYVMMTVNREKRHFCNKNLNGNQRNVTFVKKCY